MARALLSSAVMQSAALARVADRMTSPVVTEGPETSIKALTAVLELRAISAVPIVEGDSLLGIVSTTDILRAPDASTARDVMSSPVATAAPDDSLDGAARRLAAGRMHRLVVVDGARIAGILTPSDVLGELRGRKVTAPLSRAMTTPVETVDIGDSIDDASRRLVQANVHGLVVVDGSSPVGVFTHAEALAARKLPPALRDKPVEEVMSYETICLDAETPIYRAAAYVLSMNVRRVLVVEHRRLVGIVSALDLVDVLARATEA